MVVSDFCWSWVVEELELSLLEGVDEDEGGVEVAPLPAEPFVLLEELLGLVLDAPPPAWSFFCMSDEVDDEELDGAALDGVLVEPDDEDEPDGEVDGVVVLLDDEPVAERSLPARSHAVNRLAPSARETATAIVESLMRPPWLGVTWGLSNVWAGRPVT